MRKANGGGLGTAPPTSSLVWAKRKVQRSDVRDMARQNARRRQMAGDTHRARAGCHTIIRWGQTCWWVQALLSCDVAVRVGLAAADDTPEKPRGPAWEGGTCGGGHGLVGWVWLGV